MKKLLVLLLAISLTSCLGTRKVTETSTEKTTTEVSETTKDSVSTVKVNKAIDDKISTKIEATDDPYLDERIDEILQKLNTTKTSGGNAYNLYFNKKTRELIAELKIAQTADSTLVTNTEIKEEKTTEEVASEYISKTIKIIPWWAWLIVAYLLRKPILTILSFFFPGIRAVQTISDLKPKKNANK